MVETSCQESEIDSAITGFSNLLGEYAALQDVIIPNAHTMNRGVDGTSGCILGKTQFYHLKIWSKDQKNWMDFANAKDMAHASGKAGISPLLKASSSANNAFLFDHLGDGWRFAMAKDFREGGLREKAIIATKLLHALPLLEKGRSIFQRIDTMHEIVENGVTDAITGNVISIPKPENYCMMRDWVMRISRSFEAAGYDVTACHVENSLSNVMIGPSGSIKLVDFDRAANGDPLADIGALCNEYHRTEDDILQAVEIYSGKPDKAIIARVKLHMIASAFYWGLWGKVSHFLSTRREIEYYKYGENQFVRCIANISQWDVDALIRDM